MTTSNRQLQESTEDAAADPAIVKVFMMDECRSETSAIVIIVAIIILAVFFSALTLQAFAWWRISRRHNHWVKIILIVALIIIIATACFSFGAFMPLKALFTLSLLSQYLVLCSLTNLLMYLRHTTAGVMRQKVRWFLYPMHALYIVLLVWGILPEAGADCNGSSAALPTVFYMSNGLLVLTYVLLLGLKSNKFLIDWDHEGQQQIKTEQANSPTKTPPSQQKSPEEIDDCLHHEEKIFQFRTSRLLYYSTWCMFANVMTILVTLTLTNLSELITCNDQSEWVFKSCSAAIFIDMLSRLAIINSAFLPRVVFVKTERQMEMTWQESIKHLARDYKRGLSIKEPISFSDDENSGDNKSQQKRGQETSSDTNAARRKMTFSSLANSTDSKTKRENEDGKQQQQYLETQIYDGDEEQNLPTERCDTDDGLLVGSQVSAKSNRQNFKNPIQNALTMIVEEEVNMASSEKSPVPAQQKQLSLKEMKLLAQNDPTQNIQLRPFSQQPPPITTQNIVIVNHHQPQVNAAIEQGIEPRQSSSQNGSEKLTPQSTANKNERPKNPPVFDYRDNENGDRGEVARPSDTVRVQFADNNRDMMNQQQQYSRAQNANVMPRVHQTVLPSSKMQASGETGQSEELFISPGFHDDDIPLRAGGAQQQQQQPTQPVAQQNRRNRYNQNQSQSEEHSKLTVSSRPSPTMVDVPIVMTRTCTEEFKKQNALEQLKQRPQVQGMRRSLVSSLTILPEDPSENAEIRQIGQRPSDPAKTHHREIMLNETLTDGPANQTEQPVAKDELIKGRSSDFQKAFHQYNHSEMNAPNNQRETFGYAPGEMNQVFTPPADPTKKPLHQSKAFMQEIAPVHHLDEAPPKPVILVTDTTPSPMKGEDELQQAAADQGSDFNSEHHSEGSDWLSKKDDSNIYGDEMNSKDMDAYILNNQVQNSLAQGNNPIDDLNQTSKSRKSSDLQHVIDNTTVMLLPNIQQNQQQQQSRPIQNIIEKEVSQLTISPISKAATSLITPQNMEKSISQESHGQKQGNQNSFGSWKVEEGASSFGQTPKQQQQQQKTNYQYIFANKAQVQKGLVDEKDCKLGGKYGQWSDQKQRNDNNTARRLNRTLRCEVQLVKEEVKEVRVAKANVDDKHDGQNNNNHQGQDGQQSSKDFYSSQNTDLPTQILQKPELLGASNLDEEIIFEGDSKVKIIRKKPSDQALLITHSKTEKNVLKKADLISKENHERRHSNCGDKLAVPEQKRHLNKKQPSSDLRNAEAALKSRREGERASKGSFGTTIQSDAGLKDLHYDIQNHGFFPNGEADANSFIDGPGGGRTQSFISAIPTEMQQFVNNGRQHSAVNQVTKMPSYSPHSTLTANTNRRPSNINAQYQYPMLHRADTFGTDVSPLSGTTRPNLAQAALMRVIGPKIKRKRIIKSHLDPNVVNLQIVRKVTKYQQQILDAKIQQRINLVNQQHGLSSQTTQVLEESKIQKTAMHMITTTQSKTVTRIDLRKNNAPNLPAATSTFPTSTFQAQNEQTQNRFVKNILKKAGQGRQLGLQSKGGMQIQTKKTVHFTIGTGTRGQAHKDEIPLNYNGVDSASDRSFATEQSFSNHNNQQYNSHHMQNIQMAMPGQNYRNTELIRKIQQGPDKGGASLTKQILMLQKKQEHMKKYDLQYQKAEVQQAELLPLGPHMDNPFIEKSKAEDRGSVSPSDIYLQTSHGMDDVENPYEFQVPEPTTNITDHHQTRPAATKQSK